MGIQSGSLSLCRYRLLGGSTRNSIGELNGLLDNYRSAPLKLTGVQKEQLIGWVRPTGVDKLEDELGENWDLSHCQVDDGFILRMRIERRAVPAQLLQIIFKAKLKEQNNAGGKPLGPKARKELRDQVKLELMGRALPQIAHLDAFWRDRQGELMVFTTGKKMREIFEGLFLSTFAGTLGLTLVRVDPPLMGIARDAWVDSTVASETLGRLSLATPLAFTGQVYP